MARGSRIAARGSAARGSAAAASGGSQKGTSKPAAGNFQRRPNRRKFSAVRGSRSADRGRSVPNRGSRRGDRGARNVSYVSTGGREAGAACFTFLKDTKNPALGGVDRIGLSDQTWKVNDPPSINSRTISRVRSSPESAVCSATASAKL